MSIRAIRTRYKGILFRSKLEADWAITLDTFGVRWEYEPEGRYWDGKLYYAPDFWLPDIQQWFEVKGVAQDVDFKKWVALANNWSPQRSGARYAHFIDNLAITLAEWAYDGTNHTWCPPIVIGIPRGGFTSPPIVGLQRWPLTFLVAEFGFLCCAPHVEWPVAGLLQGFTYRVNGIEEFPARFTPAGHLRMAGP